MTFDVAVRFLVRIYPHLSLLLKSGRPWHRYGWDDEFHRSGHGPCGISLLLCAAIYVGPAVEG